ncbi:bicyclomycin resistance protein, putative [Talaromyces stipitatus ATCC 10500]|uniref:Bicyclomycin resistance protein, putative n=1 Tax=Talaromyces stipitatus (strain ATCC 10500 / CBS 375.48 / QM 6759 / NRRL 1006) TaxID=441959 RepID=B8M2R7_TALSN|nr:bicyclomycin resistance protein, putative [Talaromyces stipitatus ATCC 10500]EED22172.1 bicyclomycin resistance protein, putative [Talaromyces stipitatus ATCC 10500]
MASEDISPPASISDGGTWSALHEQAPQSVQVPPSASNNKIDNDIEKQIPRSEAPSEQSDADLITWSGPVDLDNPQNWSFKYKLWITAAWVYSCFVTTVASSIFSSGTEVIAAEYDVGTTIVTLGVSLFLVGYTVGPPLYGPLSEHYGRKTPLVIGMTLFTIFSIPVAVAKNIATILVGRFFQGAFGAVPLALIGGGLVDIWNPHQRAMAVTGAVGTLFWSPSLAPVMGNFMTENISWRWNQWLSCIMGGVCTILLLFFFPETYAPLLLRQKAARARKEGNPKAKSQFDGQVSSFHDVLRIYLIRGFVLLGTQPILQAVTLYQGFIYGVSYLFFVSYPIEFQEARHWDLGVSSLPFLGIVIGVLIGCAVVIFTIQRETKPPQLDADGKPIIVPEDRLPVAIFGACLIPIGLFIFAWTSNPTIHWSGMVLGSIPVGMGMYIVFLQCFNYIIDCYMTMANSALGGNAMVRSLFGASFPLFGPAMYHRLGVAWATSVLGFIGIVMIPIPVLFWKYGATIRTWSNKN